MYEALLPATIYCTGSHVLAYTHKAFRRQPPKPQVGPSVGHGQCCIYAGVLTRSVASHRGLTVHSDFAIMVACGKSCFYRRSHLHQLSFAIIALHSIHIADYIIHTYVYVKK